MSVSVLETKIYVPPPRLNAVERSALSERLLSVSRQEGSFALLSAPAGFGKTTLLADFAARVSKRQTSVAWVSLDREDNDALRFWTYLIAACSPVLGKKAESVAELLESPHPLPSDAVPTVLINELAGSADSIVLVLDDYHEIEEQSIHDGMLYLLEHLPGNLSIVISTRIDPPWLLSRFRAGNRLVELRAGDLRFDIEAASEFMRRTMALDLTDDVIATVAGRTEGWVAGLQLAALSLQRVENVAAFLSDFAGSHAYVAEYLLEEVLQRQSREVQEFLLRSSILDMMNAGLCEAVTRCADGQAILEELHRDNVFIVPLDGRNEWFRYHHLFGDLLRARLGHKSTDTTLGELHHRASIWYEHHQFLDRAVNHALKGEDFERVAELVVRSARQLIFGGRVSTVTAWLRDLPAISFDDHPQLRFFLFWTDALQNKADLSEGSIRELEEGLNSLPPTAETDRLRGELTAVVCRAVALSGRTAEGIRLAQEALARLPPDDSASRARANSAFSAAHALEGRLEVAEPAYEKCLSQAVSAGDYRLAAHATMVMGLIQNDYGRLHAAATTFQSIVDMADQVARGTGRDSNALPERHRKTATTFFPAGQGHIGLGMVHLEWNDLQAAEDHLSEGVELCRLGGLEGVFVGRMQLSRLRQARGDLDGALHEVLRLKETSRRVDDFRIITRQIRLGLAKGDATKAWHLAAPYVEALANKTAAIHAPLIFREQIQAIVAKVYIARGEPDEALKVLDRLQETAEASGRLRPLLETHLLKALVLQKQDGGGATAEISAHMRRALELGEPEGFLLLFVEEGSAIVPLLNAVAHATAVSEGVRRYAGKILEAFVPLDEAGGPTAGATASESADLIEQLTSREMEVLQLLAAGDSNQDIADKLFISLRTVKKHTSNIYGKLGAVSRTQAVALARRHRLISSD